MFIGGKKSKNFNYYYKIELWYPRREYKWDETYNKVLRLMK